MDNFSTDANLPRRRRGVGSGFIPVYLGQGYAGKANFRIFALCKNLCAYAEKTELVADPRAVRGMHPAGAGRGCPKVRPLSSADGRCSTMAAGAMPGMSSSGPGTCSRLPTVSRRRRSISTWRPVPWNWVAAMPKGRSAISRRVIPVRSMPTTCGFRWGRSIAPRAI